MSQKYRQAEITQEIVKWMQANPGHALPSVREWAQCLKMSTRTVRLALQAMVSEGHITAKTGSGYFPPGFLPAVFVRSPLKPGSMWETIAKRLIADCQSGLLSALRDFPSLKELCVQYDVSPPTMRKALTSLQAQKFLERSGRHWRLPLPSVKRKVAARVVRLVCSATDTELRIESSREQEFLRSLSGECFRMGLQLQIVGYEDRTDHPHFVWLNGKTHLRLPAMEGLVGTIFSTWHIRDAGVCLAALVREGMPVSVWLEAGAQAGVAHQFSRRDRSAFFDVGYGEEPGRTVGVFLLAQGHTQVAYISPFHGSEWSRERERGLRSALEEESGRLLSWVDENYLHAWSFRDQVIASTDWAKLLPAQKRMFAICGGWSASKQSENELVPLKECAFDLARNQRISRLLEPMFKQDLLDPKVSAWVLANDLVADLARQFLAHKLPLGQWPHLVGFDSTLPSYVYGIDSYEFNTSGLTQQMLYHIVAPKHPQFARGGVLHLKGRVVGKGKHQQEF